MTTYRLPGFTTTSFELATLSIQTEADNPVFDYSVNWRETDGLFNVSLEIEAFDILADELSVIAPNPYLDVNVVRYDWGAGQTTYALTLDDTVEGEAWAFVLGGDPVDPSQAATLWPQVIAGTATNPLPGTGFAIGEAPALSSLAGIAVTEDDLIIGTDGPDNIFSGIGNDTLKGRAGDDTLEGQDDDDLVDGGGGNDDLRGGAGDDLLLGNVGEDTLTGGEGADTLDGGQDSDTYYIDEFDTVKESRNFTGTDRIVAGFDYTLVGHYEELELTGSDDLRGIGNDLDNTLIGNTGDNILDGGQGNDTMAGGQGNDTYYLRDPGDVITEQRGLLGNDTVYTWFGTQAPAHVENLILKSTDAADLSGNSLNNGLTGNMADNILRGGNGRDTLIGLAGDDTLVGGNDRDTLSGGDGSDTYIITSSRSWIQEDTLRESAGHSGTDHVITNSRLDVRREHVENISLIGDRSYVDIRANDLDNIIRIASVGNYTEVWGYDGDDRIQITKDRQIDMYGGAGNDTLISRDGNDRLIGGAGADVMSGGLGNDVLDGGAGADVMSGGLGNDTYWVDDAGDRIIEGADGGIDRVYSRFDVGSLADALEYLTLDGGATVGNGNAKDNRIYGNNQDNLLQGLAGDDTLNGGSGNDTLRGGEGADQYEGSSGNDTYFLDAGDTLLNEYSSSGRSDTVIASVTADFGNSRNVKIENIILTGTDDIDAIRYNFGRYEGELRGNSGDNVLDGSFRAIDTMLGGLGDDTYIVRNMRDVVIEGANAGDDIVRSTVDYALSAHVERLELLGSQRHNGMGNGLDNVIVGNSGDNSLAGREGSDTLTGGAGADTFVFDRALGPNNVDTITDFSSAADMMILRSSVFTGLSGDSLNADALRGGTSVAVDADDRILYDRDTGSLYFDEDGAGGADAVLFAVLDNKTTVTADDFVIV
ncbi:MAG: calcium-binding protein [Rhodobacteraceae bacterium]|nr:calcium-binding protein [Paracoccaceae bacterium]